MRNPKIRNPKSYFDMILIGMIIDDLLGTGFHNYALHWLLPIDSYKPEESSNTVMFFNIKHPYMI